MLPIESFLITTIVVTVTQIELYLLFDLTNIVSCRGIDTLICEQLLGATAATQKSNLACLRGHRSRSITLLVLSKTFNACIRAAARN